MFVPNYVMVAGAPINMKQGATDSVSKAASLQFPQPERSFSFSLYSQKNWAAAACQWLIGLQPHANGRIDAAHHLRPSELYPPGEARSYHWHY